MVHRPAEVGPPQPVLMWMGAALLPSGLSGTQLRLYTGQVLQWKQEGC